MQAYPVSGDQIEMQRGHAAILDDKSNRGLRRVKKCFRGGNNLKFVVGEGVGDENGGLESSKPFFGLAFVNIG